MERIASANKMNGGANSQTSIPVYLTIENGSQVGFYPDFASRARGIPDEIDFGGLMPVDGHYYRILGVYDAKYAHSYYLDEDEWT